MLEPMRNERNRICSKVQRAESIYTKSSGHRRNEDGPLRTGIKRGSEVDNSRVYL